MKMYHYWYLDGTYKGVSTNARWDVSEGGEFVHQEFYTPDPVFPGVPEPELEDGIYRVRVGDGGWEKVEYLRKRRDSWYSLYGKFMGSVEDKRAGGLEVLSRLVEEEVK